MQNKKVLVAELTPPEIGRCDDVEVLQWLLDRHISAIEVRLAEGPFHGKFDHPYASERWRKEQIENLNRRILEILVLA